MPSPALGLASSRWDAVRPHWPRRPPVTPRSSPIPLTCAADVHHTIVDAAVSRWGRLDVLVNNAGALKVMSLAETTVDGIDELVGLRVTHRVCSPALPYRTCVGRRDRSSTSRARTVIGLRLAL